MSEQRAREDGYVCGCPYCQCPERIDEFDVAVELPGGPARVCVPCLEDCPT